jgi:2-haloacid dehalogenase
MMSVTRRKVITVAGAAAGVGALAAAAAVLPAAAGPPNRTQAAAIKAIAFDAFAVFDPRPVFALMERFFPGRGDAFSNEWRSRQFEYAWLRALSGAYVDFWQVTRDALDFASKRLNVSVGPVQRETLMSAYLGLNAWPDVPAALARLRKAGYRLTLLSNFTPKMLNACIESAGLLGSFDEVLSTDQAKTYKPDPRAYRLGIEALKLQKEQLLFVAHAGWDAAGAKTFGYPTYWANRLRLPAEQLGAVPDASGDSLSDLVAFLKV